MFLNTFHIFKKKDANSSSFQFSVVLFFLRISKRASEDVGLRIIKQLTPSFAVLLRVGYQASDATPPLL